MSDENRLLDAFQASVERARQARKDEPVRIDMHTGGAVEALRRVSEAAERLDRTSVLDSLNAVRAAAQRADAELRDLIDRLDEVGPGRARAESFFILSRLDAAVSGTLHVLATQAAERAVAAYKSTGGPVDTGEPE